MKISEISPRMEGVNIEGIVVEKSTPEELETRFGSALHASAVLKDETGQIKLNLWRDQAEKISISCKVRIENGFSKFGELSVGSRGRIIVLDK